MNYLKRFLFSLIIGVSFFVMPNLFGNVKAANLTIKGEKFNIINFRNMTDEEVIAAGHQGIITLRNYAKTQIANNPNKYDNYYISHNTSYSGYYLVLYKTSNLLYNYVSYYINMSTYQTSNDTIQSYLGLFFNSNNSSIASMYYLSSNLDTNIKSTSLSSGYVDNIEKKMISQRSSNIKELDNWKTPYEHNSYIDTDLPIYYKNNIKYSNTYTPITYTLNIKQANENILSYEPDQMIIDSTGSLVGNKPTIKFGKNDIGKSTFINVEFDIFDTNKYIYEYSLYDTKNWIEISQNYFLKQVYQDGTIFVRIKDRQTDEYITSASFQILNVVPGGNDIGNNNNIYEHEGKTYSSYIRIPITEVYDYQNNVWKDYRNIFIADSKDSTQPKIDFYIYLKDKEGVSSSNPIPLLVYLNNNIMDLQEYLEAIKNSPNSNPDGYGGGFSLGGGSFGGGGGGGRFDDDTSPYACTRLPLTYEIEMKSFVDYLSLTLNFKTCQDISNKTPEDFTTEYIYIFYNGKVYKDEYEAIDDLFKPSDSSNIFDFFNSNNNMSSEIGSMINNVWTYFKNNQISGYIFLLVSGTLIIVLINGFNR